MIPANVKRGAAWLDEHEPGWRGRIDLNKVDLASECNCVLGQLYGGYTEALQHFDLTDKDARRLGFWRSGSQRWWQLSVGWLAEVARVRL